MFQLADKHEWVSVGLKTVPERALEVKSYKVCRRHNLLVSWAEGENEPPLPCGDDVAAHKFVIPSFGFVGKTQGNQPRARPARMYTTRPYFLHPAGPEPGEIKIRDRTGKPVVTIFTAIPAKMGVLSEGHRNRRFYICLSCGAGFNKPKRQHSSPWGESCDGTLRQLALGHEFVTDAVQVEFHVSPEKASRETSMWIGYGIACAMLEGLAEGVGVPSTDLNATVGHPAGSTLPRIVLYDDVPGGAGLVAKIEDLSVFRQALVAARDRTAGGCGCSEETSCYGCLRSYRNQFAHPHLHRGVVNAYLNQIISMLPE